MPEYEDDHGNTYEISFSEDFINGRYEGEYLPRDVFDEMISDYWEWKKEEKKDYSQYLNSEEWDAKKKAKLKEVNYECQRCGIRQKLNDIPFLQVHHKHYENVKKEDPKDLVVLCDECHEMAHEDPLEYHGCVVGGKGMWLKSQGHKWD